MRYILGIICGLVILAGCTAKVKNFSEVGYVSPDYSFDGMKESGLALLPVVTGAGQEGYRRPLGDCLNSMIDSALALPKFVKWENVMEQLNAAGLTKKYQDAITAYIATSAIDTSVLGQVGNKLGVKYLMFVSLGDYRLERGTAYTLSGPNIEKISEFKAFVQIWDISRGDIVWEANAIARSKGSGGAVKIQSYENHARVAATGVVKLLAPHGPEK